MKRVRPRRFDAPSPNGTNFISKDVRTNAYIPIDDTSIDLGHFAIAYFCFPGSQAIPSGPEPVLRRLISEKVLRSMTAMELSPVRAM